MPKVISEMVGGALLGAAANRQVGPTISEEIFWQSLKGFAGARLAESASGIGGRRPKGCCQHDSFVIEVSRLKSGQIKRFGALWRTIYAQLLDEPRTLIVITPY